jgi:hypothetical protein
LASEGLPYDATAERGRQERVPVAINLYDSSGTFLSTLRVEASSDFTEGDYMAQMDQETIDAACIQAAQVNRTDDESALADVGITEGTFLPEFWSSRIADLRNAAERAGVEDFRIEVKENGEIILHSSNPEIIGANPAAFLSLINNDPDVTSRARLVREGDSYRVTNVPSSAQVEAVAHHSGANLSDEELRHVTEITDGINQSDLSLTRIERDEDGIIRLSTSGMLPQNFIGDEFNGYRVARSEVMGGSAATELTLVPPGVESPLFPAAAPSLPDRPDNRTPASEAGRAPVAESVADIDDLSPTQQIYRLDLLGPEDRVSVVLPDRVLDTNPGLNNAYNLVVAAASRFPLLEANVIDNGQGFEITIDANYGGADGSGYTPAELRQFEASLEANGPSIRKIRESDGRIVYRISQ